MYDVLTYRQVLTKDQQVKKEEATKVRWIGNILVDRRPLLEKGFTPAEIVDDWDTVIDPMGILNAENATVIVDYNHNSQSTGAKFIKASKGLANIKIQDQTFLLPALKSEVLFEKGNKTTIGSKEIDVFEQVKNGEDNGWSAGLKPKSFRFFDDDWQDVTQEVKKLVGVGNWKFAPNLVSEISKGLNKKVYCCIDSFYLFSLSVLNKEQQGHYDASIDQIILERKSKPHQTILNFNNIKNMPNTIHTAINSEISKQFDKEDVNVENVKLIATFDYDGQTHQFNVDIEDPENPVLSDFKTIELTDQEESSTEQGSETPENELEIELSSNPEEQPKDKNDVDLVTRLDQIERMLSRVIKPEVSSEPSEEEKELKVIRQATEEAKNKQNNEITVKRSHQKSNGDLLTQADSIALNKPVQPVTPMAKERQFEYEVAKRSYYNF